MSTTDKKPTESKIQQQCYVWYNNTYCLPQHSPQCIIWHVPNEQQQHLTNIGVLPGVADLCLIHAIAGVQASTHVYIEVKTPTGKQSPAQADFMRRVQALGYAYHVVRSLDEFVAAIQATQQALLPNNCNNSKP